MFQPNTVPLDPKTHETQIIPRNMGCNMDVITLKNEGCGLKRKQPKGAGKKNVLLVGGWTTHLIGTSQIGSYRQVGGENKKIFENTYIVCLVAFNHRGFQQLDLNTGRDVQFHVDLVGHTRLVHTSSCFHETGGTRVPQSRQAIFGMKKVRMRRKKNNPSSKHIAWPFLDIQNISWGCGVFKVCFKGPKIPP